MVARILFIIFIGGFTLHVDSQTSGTLNFTCTTAAPSGNWGDKHVLAAWVQNDASPSIFIKTRVKYGSQDDHLTSWSVISGKNTVDAVTGATLGSYGNISVSWDGTDVNKNQVADGNYTLYIEMGWGKDKVVQHAVASFDFTKGPVQQHLTPTATSNYLNVILDWKPNTTILTDVSNKGEISVYPNPSTGIIQIGFKREMPDVSISVVNLAGEVVYSETLTNQNPGIKILDLSDYKSGVYILVLHADKFDQHVKLVLRK